MGLRRSTMALATVAMAAAVFHESAGQTGFRRIADTDTATPTIPVIQPCADPTSGGCGIWPSVEGATFDSFGLPTAAGPIGFRAESEDQSGVPRMRGLYAVASGALVRVADSELTAPPLDPNVDEHYLSFSHPSVDPDTGVMLFAADHTRTGGVFRRGSLYLGQPAALPPPLELLEDDVFDSPANPGAGPNVFGTVSAHLGGYAYLGRNFATDQGLVPLGPNNEEQFTIIGAAGWGISYEGNGSVVFNAVAEDIENPLITRFGVFRSNSSGITTLVDTQTTVPGTQGTFDSFGPVVSRSSDTFFRASGASRQGIYRIGPEGDSTGGSGSQLQTVADIFTPVPVANPSAQFFGFDPFVSAQNQSAVFTASGLGFTPGGGLQKGLFMSDPNNDLTALYIEGEPFTIGRRTFYAVNVELGPESAGSADAATGPGPLLPNRVAVRAAVGPFSDPTAPRKETILLLDPSGAGFGGPGTSQDEPIKPTANPDPGVYQFNDVLTDLWIDPPPSVGFEFEMLGDSRFTAILDFPTGFDQPFEVYVADELLGAFEPGELVEFPNGGVEAFTVLGIDPPAPSSSGPGFPIQLEFDAITASFTMTAIPVPEPSAALLLALGMLALGVFCR